MHRISFIRKGKLRMPDKDKITYRQTTETNISEDALFRMFDRIETLACNIIVTWFERREKKKKKT